MVATTGAIRNILALGNDAFEDVLFRRLQQRDRIVERLRQLA
jgi:hypothetical protein